jgi:hypothetical protein
MTTIPGWATPRLNLLFKYLQETEVEARLEGEWLVFNLTYIPEPLF